MINTSVQIHPTAIVEPGAQLDSGVSIGPYAIVGKNVKIGKGTQVHSHALISGYTTLGEDNQVFSYASVGNPPQDLKYKGEPTTLEIGDRNVIREFATLQPGTIQDRGNTLVGNENLFMAYTHVAHDCVIGNQNILANCTQLAGHVTINDMVVMGAFVGIHQFVHIGSMAMLAAGAMVNQDVPPFCIAEGNRAYLRGLNLIGLKRRGLDSTQRNAIKNAYKIIFLRNHPTIDSALNELEEFLPFKEVQSFVDFIKNSKRGTTRPNSDNSSFEE